MQSEFAQDVNLADTLSEQHVSEVKDLLASFGDILSDVPSQTNLIEHGIVTTTSDLVKARNHPIPFHVEETINEEVSKMLKLGIIEPSSSSYSAPFVIVKKRSGENRFCIDFRGLNQVTATYAKPMPDTEVIFSRLAENKYFT